MDTKNRPEQTKSTGTETGNNPGRPTGQNQFGSTPTGSSEPNQGQSNTSQYTQGATGSAARPARDLSAERTRNDQEQSSPTQRGMEALEHAKQSVNEAYDRTSKALNQSYEQAVDYGRDNPGKTALIAFGVGIGVGLWLANTATPRNRASRIVPPVMNAVSNIVSELFR